MKFIAIGDPHGNVEKLKTLPYNGVDAALVTGDIGKADLARKFAFARIEREKQGLPRQKQTAEETKQIAMEIHDSAVAVMQYLGNIIPSHTIYGNVEPSNSDVRKDNRKYGLHIPFLTDVLKATPGVKIINNRIVRFGDLRVGGLEFFVDDCWVKTFKPAKDYNKRFAQARKQTISAKDVLNKFGYVDVLVCHQPPLGFLDEVTAPFAPEHWKGKHAGSKVILDYIKKHQPKYVFCGHIHEGEGHAKIGKTEVYNLGVCGYKVFEL